MNIFKRLFSRRAVGPSNAEEAASFSRARRMLEMAKESTEEHPLSKENATQVVKEESSVTGVYQVVASAIEDAMGEKRKAREAAQRVSSAIGVPPPPPKPKTS